MKGFKFEPVRWATRALALLTALIGVDAMFHLLPATWTPWLLAAEALLALLLGRQVRSVVTPLAAPKAANGRALVPTPPATVPPGTPRQHLRADDGTD